MTNLKQEIRAAQKDYDRAVRERAKARAHLRRVLAKAKEKHTGEEVAAMWGRSRQSLYKIMGEKP